MEYRCRFHLEIFTVFSIDVSIYNMWKNLQQKKEKFRFDAFGYTQIHRPYTQNIKKNVTIRFECFSLAARFLSHTVYLYFFFLSCSSVSSSLYLPETVRTHKRISELLQSRYWASIHHGRFEWTKFHGFFWIV